MLRRLTLVTELAAVLHAALLADHVMQQIGDRQHLIPRHSPG
jgi:hypothetical protein